MFSIAYNKAFNEISVRYIQLDSWDFDFTFCSLLESFSFKTENKSHIIKYYSLGSKNVSFFF